MGVILLVSLAVLAGFILIAIAGRSPVQYVAERPTGEHGDMAQAMLESLSLAQFEGLCIRLLEELGLVVNGPVRRRRHEIEISAVNPQPIIGGDVLVHCVLAHDARPVDVSAVQSLSDTVKADGASKGILITNGYFAEDVGMLSEGPPVELINAPRFRSLLEEHRIPLT
jgi:restriction system protein